MVKTNQTTVELVSSHGGDRRISEKAWVSTATGEGRTYADVHRLVKFLYRNVHSQPFMGSGVAFRVSGPYRTLVQIKMALEDEGIDVNF